jgi:hypothetical protein
VKPRPGGTAAVPGKGGIRPFAGPAVAAPPVDAITNIGRRAAGDEGEDDQRAHHAGCQPAFNW